ncbi:hypothetical protein [Roseburia sp. 499]|uniref:hypothetical protein n=1 Tax=Roseburia sp. 499 TaxID=1261634 RepID=UPI000952FFE9|nr:hypothetical protein [Roseburia sp. 499]WVK70766.1 hypothetical protein BIV20_04315 [Roseburia sp. 499]
MQKQERKMNFFKEKCYIKVSNMAGYKYILFSVFASVIVACIMATIEERFSVSSQNIATQNIILVIFIGPYVETLVLVCVISILKKIIKKKIIVILMVDFIFTQLHTVSILSKVCVFFMMFLAMYGYLVHESKRISPFMKMYVIHAAYNGSLVILSQVTK